MLLLNLSSIEEHAKTGKVKILAAATEKRLAARPDLPTVAESGVPGFQTSVWFGLWGPPNMPAELVGEDPRRRRQGARPSAVARVLQDQQLRAGRPVARAVRRTLIQSDLKHWSTLIKAVGAKVE